jgi:hypothetical protein
VGVLSQLKRFSSKLISSTSTFDSESDLTQIVDLVVNRGVDEVIGLSRDQKLRIWNFETGVLKVHHLEQSIFARDSRFNGNQFRLPHHPQRYLRAFDFQQETDNDFESANDDTSSFKLAVFMSSQPLPYFAIYNIQLDKTTDMKNIHLLKSIPCEFLSAESGFETLVDFMVLPTTDEGIWNIWTLTSSGNSSEIRICRVDFASLYSTSHTNSDVALWTLVKKNVVNDLESLSNDLSHMVYSIDHSSGVKSLPEAYLDVIFSSLKVPFSEIDLKRALTRYRDIGRTGFSGSESTVWDKTKNLKYEVISAIGASLVLDSKHNFGATKEFFQDYNDLLRNEWDHFLGIYLDERKRSLCALSFAMFESTSSLGQTEYDVVVLASGHLSIVTSFNSFENVYYLFNESNDTFHIPLPFSLHSRHVEDAIDLSKLIQMTDFMNDIPLDSLIHEICNMGDRSGLDQLLCKFLSRDMIEDDYVMKEAYLLAHTSPHFLDHLGNIITGLTSETLDNLEDMEMLPALSSYHQLSLVHRISVEALHRNVQARVFIMTRLVGFLLLNIKATEVLHRTASSIQLKELFFRAIESAKSVICIEWILDWPFDANVTDTGSFLNIHILSLSH